MGHAGWKSVRAWLAACTGRLVNHAEQRAGLLRLY
jgi:hypothetical protein